jgi:CRP-like cAMP-binding protein
MTSNHAANGRLLPDGTPLKNRLLSALPEDLYARVARDLRMIKVTVGEPLQQHGLPIIDAYFPNGGVYSVTNQMQDGSLVEVATVGTEGMVGVCLFLGDLTASGTSLQQVPNGALPALSARRFVEYVSPTGPFRDVMARYAQAHMVQIMQCTACNALHSVEQRCCKWLLQTHDRVEGDEFQLKHEFLAIMLGSHRPTVTLVLGALQKGGLISTKYGRIIILNRAGLEAASCECYDAIRGQFARLGLANGAPGSDQD